VDKEGLPAHNYYGPWKLPIALTLGSPEIQRGQETSRPHLLGGWGRKSPWSGIWNHEHTVLDESTLNRPQREDPARWPLCHLLCIPLHMLFSLTLWNLMMWRQRWSLTCPQFMTLIRLAPPHSVPKFFGFSKIWNFTLCNNALSSSYVFFQAFPLSLLEQTLQCLSRFLW
jgi:hypothetical protein